MRSSSRFALVASLLAALTVATAPLSAQIRGGQAPRRANSGMSNWWFSGGAVVAGLGAVNDGKSASTWDFGGDPRWQMRGTLEKAIQPTTTLGIAVNYGTVDFQYRPLAGAGVLDPFPGDTGSVGVCRVDGCTGQVDLMGIQGVLRGGNAAEGMYQIVEATGGVIGFRNMRVKSDGAALPVEMSYDVTAGIGYGLGFALSSDFHLAFVQDFGIAWHSGDQLPENTKRTYNTRNTRVTLRYGLGSRR